MGVMALSYLFESMAICLFELVLNRLLVFACFFFFFPVLLVGSALLGV